MRRAGEVTDLGVSLVILNLEVAAGRLRAESGS
jgi:hypothetical protein